jgi:hypothetical protein
MAGYTYDTGALLAAEARRLDMWAMHRDALDREVAPVVPAGVLAQAWRGGPQPLLSKLLHGCAVEPFDEAEARQAGNACGLAGTSDVVDAAVVVGAMARGDAVVTSDPDDLVKIADALGGKLVVRVV